MPRHWLQGHPTWHNALDTRSSRYERRGVPEILIGCSSWVRRTAHSAFSGCRCPHLSDRDFWLLFFRVSVLPHVKRTPCSTCASRAACAALVCTGPVASASARGVNVQRSRAFCARYVPGPLGVSGPEFDWPRIRTTKPGLAKKHLAHPVRPDYLGLRITWGKRAHGDNHGYHGPAAWPESTTTKTKAPWENGAQARKPVGAGGRSAASGARRACCGMG